jgi:hypothetical protein
MKRVLSILLALLFGLGPLTAALPASEDLHLPACCRRHGMHHCAMFAEGSAQKAADGHAALSAPATCPYYPGAMMAPIAPTHALLALTPDFAVRESSTGVVSDAGIAPGSSAACTHAGRGPPTSVLS